MPMVLKVGSGLHDAHITRGLFFVNDMVAVEITKN